MAKITRREFIVGVGTGVAGLAIGTIVGRQAFPRTVEVEVLPAPPPPAYTKLVTLKVNGEIHELEVGNNWSLLYVLREKLGLTGAKLGCGQGNCGSCTIIMDGRPVLSCLVLAVEAEGKDILTVEGLRDPVTGEISPIQRAFIENEGLQCGFCTPGQIMAAKALLDVNPRPTEDEVREALANNLCRCGAYPGILKSVLAAAGGR